MIIKGQKNKINVRIRDKRCQEFCGIRTGKIQRNLFHFKFGSQAFQKTQNNKIPFIFYQTYLYPYRNQSMMLLISAMSNQLINGRWNNESNLTQQMSQVFKFYKFSYLFQIFIFYSSLYFRNPLFEPFLSKFTNEQLITLSIGQQPYYFELVTRNIITRRNDKDHGLFRFYIHKNSQRVDFSKSPFKAIFSQKRMKVDNLRFNFYLPNYFPGKNYNSKFILSLTQQNYNNQKHAGSYTIDPNIYIEEYKRNGQNHYAQFWEISDDYSVEVEIFFDQSKYALEKLLKDYRDKAVMSFTKPLISKSIEYAKKAEIQQDKEYDDEERYNDQRMKLFNKYAGALVGHGGYRIFDEESQKIVKKQTQFGKTNARHEPNQNQPINTPSKSKLSQDHKNLHISKNNSIKKGEEKSSIKETIISQEANPEAQIKNIKFLIIGVVLLIFLGFGYFLSKIFLREDARSIEMPTKPKDNKAASGRPNKSKAKTSKKSKNSQQL